MGYGLKYNSQFDSESDANNPSVQYTLQFLFKDYSGPVISIIGGDTTVIQRCTVDDPLATIKGQSLDISLINQGNLPITSFYADNDSDIQVKLIDSTGAVKFIGFLVQDDCTEIKVDYDHQINLSATDSIGLLKDTILSDAKLKRLYNAVVRTNGPLNEILISIDNPAFYAYAGDILDLLGTTYIIQSVSNVPIVISGQNYNFTITVTVAAPGIIAPVDTAFYITGALNLLNRNSLLSIIGACLSATNLELITNIFCNLREFRQNTTESHFAQTFIDSQTFINGETYDNCYNVLSRILATFECSLFQANGQWQIVHWFEIRKFPSLAIKGWVYDETLLLINTTTFSNIFFIGPEPQLTIPTFPLTETIIRPYKFTRKTFNYQTPKYLLKNFDFHQLGALIRQYVDGVETVKEYVATDWEDGEGSPMVERFIRVVYDSLGNELRRYFVDKNGASAGFGVRAKPIEVTAGDKIKYSFSFRTTNSQAGNINFVFIVKVTNGIINRYLDEVPTDNGDWLSTFGFTYNIPAGDNSDQWHTVEMTSSQIPFDGLLYLYLPMCNIVPSSTKETWIRDVRLEITSFINDSTKIIGHIHKDNRTNNIKNNLDEEIYIDDSPRNTIQGTLFLSTINNLIQDRTTLWEYGTDFNGYKIGNITTAEILTCRSKMRSKLEGGFLGLSQNALPASLLTIAITDFNTTKNYIFGLLNIDYKRNAFSGTLFEIWDTTEPDLAADYTFTYIYNAT